MSKNEQISWDTRVRVPVCTGEALENGGIVTEYGSSGSVLVKTFFPEDMYERTIYCDSIGQELLLSEK